MSHISEDKEVITYPDIAHIEGDTVGGDTLVVRRLENVVITVAIGETLAKVGNLGIELLGDKDLMWQPSEAEVEEVCESAVFQSWGLGKPGPDALKVRLERGCKVFQRCCANVVTDNEEKKSALIGAEIMMSDE
jgi:hypothetical protein